MLAIGEAGDIGGPAETHGLMALEQDDCTSGDHCFSEPVVETQGLAAREREKNRPEAKYCFTETWVADSGASCHMSGSKLCMYDFEEKSFEYDHSQW